MPANGKPIDLPNLDDTVTRLPEDIRQDLAVAASSDLFSFCRGVLGYKDLTMSCHGPLCVFFDTNENRFKLTLQPRGHLKTTIGTIGRNLQKVVRNPEVRVLIGNETATNAQRFLGAIKSHAENNRIFRSLYSHVLPRGTRPNHWSNEELLFHREGNYPEPTIDTIGMEGAMTSRHYTHLCFDDPISEDAARSKEVMDNTINRMSKLLSLMVNPEIDTMDLTGTRWAFYDVYSYFIKWFGPRIACFVRGAIEEGKPIWPERFSLDALALIRDNPNMGEYMFSCLYMNNPRNVAVQDFNVQDLRFWRYTDDEEHLVLYDQAGEIVRIVEFDDLDITVTCDVRYGEKLSSDRDAVVVVGCTNEGDAIVLSTWAERSNPLRVIDELIRVTKRYHPRCLGIQKVGYEMSLKWHLAAALERENLYLNVVPIKPGGPGKTHIRGLQPIAATGHLYLLPTMHIVRQELAEYPLSQYDDVADALALQPQLWRGLLSPERIRKYREHEDRILRRTVDYGMVGVPGMTDTLQRDDRGNLPSLDDLGIDLEDSRYGQITEHLLGL